MSTAADLRRSGNELCILVKANIWRKMCFDGISYFEAWAVNHDNFPNKCGIKRSRRNYLLNICQMLCHFQFHVKISGHYQSVNFLLTHTVVLTLTFELHASLQSLSTNL